MAFDHNVVWHLGNYAEDPGGLDGMLRAWPARVNALLATEGSSLLMGAVVYPVLFARLLAGGADVMYRASDARTVLHAVARSGTVDQWESALKTAARPAELLNVGVGTKQGTALHALARGSNRADADAWVRLAIAHGADIEAIDSRGDTPLVEAALQDNPHIVRALLAAGANPNAHNTEGVTSVCLGALCAPGTNGRTGICGLLTRKKLHRTSSADIVRALVAAGADLNFQNSAGNTPIHVDITAGGELVRVLAGLGARTDIRNNAGNTPFAYAARDVADLPALFELMDATTDWTLPADAVPLARRAVSAEADWRAREASAVLFGRRTQADAPFAAFASERDTLRHTAQFLLGPPPDETLLHVLVDFNEFDPARLSQARLRGVPLEARDALGDTPLLAALRINTLDAARAAQHLIWLGASADARDAHGRTALAVATHPQQRQSALVVLAMLPHATPATLGEARVAAGVAGSEFAEELVAAELHWRRRLDANLREPPGDTPLHVLAESSDKSTWLAEMLARSVLPIDVDARNASGRTALQVLAHRNRAPVEARLSMIAALLEAGANPNAVDDKGHTALWLAAHTHHGPASEFVGLLVRSTANLELPRNAHARFWEAVAAEEARRYRVMARALNAHVDPAALAVALARIARGVIDEL